MYDLFFIGEHTPSIDGDFASLKEITPFAKRAMTFEQAQEKSVTKMFWAVWPGVVVDSNFNFDFRPSLGEEEYIHIWPNSVDKNLPSIGLFPKNKTVTKRELEYRFFVGMIKMNNVATFTKGYDIAFISNYELNANLRFKELLTHPGRKANRTFHVEGIKGIHNAHIEAAKQATTNMFWVVDADCEILPTFKFNLALTPEEEEMVHLWYSRNPVNHLEYGFGGLKLFPREKVLNMSNESVDMTTSISKDIKIIPEVANITHFNTDSFSAWRSAFRECTKLSSRVINGQVDKETEERLKVWLSGGKDKPYAEYVRGGASAGQWYGSTYRGDKNALAKINDYEWLKEEYEQHIKMFPPSMFK